MRLGILLAPLFFRTWLFKYAAVPSDHFLVNECFVCFPHWSHTYIYIYTYSYVQYHHIGTCLFCIFLYRCAYKILLNQIIHIYMVSVAWFLGTLLCDHRCLAKHGGSPFSWAPMIASVWSPVVCAYYPARVSDLIRLVLLDKKIGVGYVYVHIYIYIYIYRYRYRYTYIHTYMHK